MAFRVFKGHATKKAAAGCAVGVIQTTTNRFSIKVRIGTDVLDELGWTPETCVVLKWGDNGHAGKVMISENPGGLATTWPGRARAAYVQTSVVPVGIIPNHKVSSTPVHHEITDKNLVIDLPEFAAE